MDPAGVSSLTCALLGKGSMLSLAILLLKNTEVLIGYNVLKGSKGLWSRAMLMSSFWQHPWEFRAIYSQLMFENYSKCTFPGHRSRQFEFVVSPISKDRNSMLFWEERF